MFNCTSTQESFLFNFKKNNDLQLNRFIFIKSIKSMFYENYN